MENVAHLPNFTFDRIEASGCFRGVGLFHKVGRVEQENPKATTHTLYEEKNGFEMWRGKFNQTNEKFVVQRRENPK